MLKIGHRGALGLAPENTLASFQKGLDLNVDMIELDVHICRSGELVVIHDETLDRTTNGVGSVADKTLAELKQLDAGDGQQIPTLKEVFDLIDKQVPIHVELKGLGTAKPAYDLIQEYIKNKAWIEEHFFISSFTDQELEDFYKLNQTIRLGILNIHPPADYLGFAKKINAYSIHFDLKNLTKEMVEQVHQAGYKVNVYTVNEPVDIQRMKDWGVDGIFTNYPDRL